MKKIRVVIITGIVSLLINVQAFTQMMMPMPADSVIAPYRLAVTYHKTTNLVFPYAIKSVDRGSNDILAQKAKGVENILQVKAGKSGFDETNLTVITADGTLYSYLLNYVDSPSVLNISFSNKMQSRPETFFSQSGINEAEVQSDAEKLVTAKRTIKGIRDGSYGIKFRLDGIYINEDVMYFRVRISNRTNINYDINQLRFFIRDQQKSRRTATQELEIYPLHTHNNASTVAGRSEEVFVFAVPKFTIPDKKYLAIQLMERNGGRNLELQVKNKKIVKAVPID